jgi:hypothetical protein
MYGIKLICYYIQNYFPSLDCVDMMKLSSIILFISFHDSKLKAWENQIKRH